MFCDLVDSTELSQRIDPEELREILITYQEACSEAVRRFDGHVAQYLGDGLLVYFGYPHAHEDDAERAVRAALAIRTSLERLNRGRVAAGSEPIAARVGVHTGLVVVAEVGGPERQETLAMGDAVNVAARIQSLAEPGGILISHMTQRLVTGPFVTRDLGTPPLKGVSEPIRVYSVEGSAGVSSRFRVTGALTPLRGRDQELRQLLEGWERVKTGNGQTVAISGEPGIGKSRLLHAFRQRLADTRHFTLELGCASYTAGSAFQPLIELLQAGAGFSEEDEPETKLARLEESLSTLQGLELQKVVPYLAALLELPPSERFPLEHMGPELQRELTLDALMAPFLALAVGQPLVVICEDLHWSDPSTLELLGRLIDAAPTLPMLILLAFRSEFVLPSEIARERVSSVVLERLTKEDTRAVIETVAGAESQLPRGVLDQIAERADGVPLFAEELARAVFDAGLVAEEEGRYEHGGATSRIPATLQDSLMARLDSLSAAKKVAQLGATLGRHFSYPMIEAIAGIDMARSGLAPLVDAGILHQEGVPPEATYRFKHALLRDTAYESQLISARRVLHARIAAILEERYPQRVASEPEVMARHCAEADLTEQAVVYYQQAGEQAVARLSNAEAVEHFQKALELIEPGSTSEETRLKEIELRLALGGPLAALRGYEDPEAVRSCERMEELCDAVGAGPQQLPALLGLTLYHLNCGHVPKARGYADSLLGIAEPLGIAPLCVAGHMIKGVASLTTATISEGCHHLQKAIEIGSNTELRSPRAAFDIDALTSAHCTYAIALVVAGKSESALQTAEQGLRRARELGHPRTLASALANCAMASHLLDDSRRTEALAEECLEVLADRGFHTVECSVRVLLGWARARHGDPNGISDLEEGLRLSDACGTLGGLVQSHFAAADVYTRAGLFEKASGAVDSGAAVIERTGERVGYQPQIPTLRARILLESDSGSAEQAAALLLESLVLWKRSQAPWLALDSAILLGRIASDAGKRKEARAQLSELCGGIAEGLDTARLREARRLLDDLA
jgi:class 3 adenylate cyclase/tetratricopeptide (TPR) repeat protein